MKPIILGMNNPLSDDPEFDLYPYPERSTGWRLWKMLPEGTTRKQYLDAFERRNLLRARTWSQSAARTAAQELAPWLCGRLVIVLGTEVRSALGLPKAEPLKLHPMLQHTGHDIQPFAWIAFPHPSGRNYWYNNADNLACARKVLTDMFLDSLTTREVP